MTINDVPGRKDKSGKPINQPGGIFRFTHLQLTQGRTCSSSGSAT